jgi:hypothetical protein
VEVVPALHGDQAVLLGAGPEAATALVAMCRCSVDALVEQRRDNYAMLAWLLVSRYVP